ncbi:chromate transporter [Facklamia miroungae]|uniref:Chromate transporter n=1 Tax=Facklamia miroungae TaxID=120956 RepID=A0A1G7TLH2_9LACT|nr:chromate transporter [Facklamia miroungae]NKZ29815.1 chromate transporter [Facklamia miroungae]SDG35350.1 chromate transporter [Facklamia miroungae]
MIYWQLFLTFLNIGLLSFGGGYAALPIIEDLVVHQEHWLTLEEFSHLITISQMTPGPIAINASTFIGTQIGGVGGAVAATIGCTLPSIIIVTFLAYLYHRYQKLSLMQDTLFILRPVVVALIASSGLSIFINAIWGNERIIWMDPNWLMLIIFSVAMFFLNKFKANPILIMLSAGLVNIIYHAL